MQSRLSRPSVRRASLGGTQVLVDMGHSLVPVTVVVQIDGLLPAKPPHLHRDPEVLRRALAVQME